MTILALDFDGVMHPRYNPMITRTEPVFCRLPLLEAWLREQPHVDVIISSSWRELHPFDEMVSYFSDDLQSRILGITPTIWKVLGPNWRVDHPHLFERQFEIESWMAEHAQGRKWVALDDDHDGHEEGRYFEPGCPQLCKVDHRTGLKPGALYRLTRMVNSC